MNIGRRRLVLALILVVTIAAGLATREPAVLAAARYLKYPGDVLWAAAVYLFLALVFVQADPPCIAATAAVISAGVEFFKLYDPPALHHLRYTFVGHLFLGQVFSWQDLASYLIGIVAIFAIDGLAVSRRSPTLK